MSSAIKLTVLDARKDDVFRDIVRVNEAKRGYIVEGSVCLVAVNGKSKRLVVRGLPLENDNYIRLDEISRNTLGVGDNSTHHFTITKVGWLGQIAWACSAADAGARIAAWIALWSFGVGIVGIILSVWGSVK